MISFKLLKVFPALKLKNFDSSIALLLLKFLDWDNFLLFNLANYELVLVLIVVSLLSNLLVIISGQPTKIFNIEISSVTILPKPWIKRW